MLLNKLKNEKAWRREKRERRRKKETTRSIRERKKNRDLMRILAVLFWEKYFELHKNIFLKENIVFIEFSIPKKDLCFGASDGLRCEKDTNKR